MLSTDYSTVKILFTINFHSEVVKFVFSAIPIFDTKIIKIQEDYNVVPSHKSWKE